MSEEIKEGEATKVSKYDLKPMADTELRQLAMDVSDDKVFLSLSVKTEDFHLIPNIFMPVMFMEFEDVKYLADNKITLYEYLSEAGERGINGYPMFWSCRMLGYEDLNKLRTLVKEIEVFKDRFKKPQQTESTNENK